MKFTIIISILLFVTLITASPSKQRKSDSSTSTSIIDQEAQPSDENSVRNKREQSYHIHIIKRPKHKVKKVHIIPIKYNNQKDQDHHKKDKHQDDRIQNKKESQDQHDTHHSYSEVHEQIFHDKGTHENVDKNYEVPEKSKEFETEEFEPIAMETQEHHFEEHKEKVHVKHHHHHHHHNHVKTIVKKVEVPVEKIVHVPVEKKVQVKVPYPVEKIVHVPKPYPVEKIVEKIVHVPKPYPVEKIVEKVVHVPVEKIVHVPKPYPVEKIVEKIVHVPKPYPVIKHVPYPVEVKIPVHIPKPYPVEKRVPYPVEVEKKVPVPYKVEVEKKVPYPVKVYVQQPSPYKYEKPITDNYSNYKTSFSFDSSDKDYSSQDSKVHQVQVTTPAPKESARYSSNNNNKKPGNQDFLIVNRERLENFIKTYSNQRQYAPNYGQNQNPSYNENTQRNSQVNQRNLDNNNHERTQQSTAESGIQPVYVNPNQQFNGNSQSHIDVSENLPQPQMLIRQDESQFFNPFGQFPVQFIQLEPLQDSIQYGV